MKVALVLTAIGVVSIAALFAVFEALDRREAAADRRALIADNEALVRGLPAYPGSTEEPIRTSELNEGDPVSRLVGYLTTRRLMVKNASPEQVRAFYERRLRQRGWRSRSNRCDAFYYRGATRPSPGAAHLELSTCTNGRVDLRSWIHLPER